jgi:predicted nucleic acid-binding protein
MKPSVYLETSVISYLASHPSDDPAVAANQQTTQEWWQARADRFDLYISQLVIEEAKVDDEDVAERRMAVLVDLPSLELKWATLDLAEALAESVPIPEQAIEDALHVALATVHGMDYLLTWDREHMADVAIRDRIERICRSQGYEPPTICTPRELLEE